jgi:hypothetical protein
MYLERPPMSIIGQQFRKRDDVSCVELRDRAKRAETVRDRGCIAAGGLHISRYKPIQARPAEVIGCTNQGVAKIELNAFRVGSHDAATILMVHVKQNVTCVTGAKYGWDRSRYSHLTIHGFRRYHPRCWSGQRSPKPLCWLRSLPAPIPLSGAVGQIQTSPSWPVRRAPLGVSVDIVRGRHRPLRLRAHPVRQGFYLQDGSHARVVWRQSGLPE